MITAAYGVGPDYVRTFLRTFRAVNERARVIVMVNDHRHLADIADHYNAELHRSCLLCRLTPTIKLPRKRQRVRPTEALSRTNPLLPKCGPMLPDHVLQVLVPLPVSRLFHTRHILNNDLFDMVLVSDCRDVLFQTDPFAIPIEFELAREPGTLGSCSFNDKWIREGFGTATLKHLSGKPIYCSGTILGRYERVRDHIDRMCTVVRHLRSWRCFGQDQGVHNYVIHTQTDDATYSVSTNQRGLIATVGLRPDVRIEGGYVVDVDGKPFPIVHQFDRLSTEELKQLRLLTFSDDNDRVSGF